MLIRSVVVRAFTVSSGLAVMVTAAWSATRLVGEARVTDRVPADIIRRFEPAAVRATALPRQTSLQLTWSPERALFVGSGLSGTVTAHPFSGTRPVNCGDPVLEVDGRALFALCGERPLWRPVTSSTVGQDADQVRELLRQLGLLEPEEQRAARVAEAIRAFNKLANGTSDDSQSIRPAHVVWIGGPIPPATIVPPVGTAVAPASPALKVPASVASAYVIDAPGSDVRAATWTFSEARLSAPVHLDDTGAVADTDLARLTALVETDGRPATTVTGIVQLDAEQRFVAVPGSSLLAADASRQCVLTMPQPGTTASADVVVAAYAAGLAYLATGVSEGTMVLVNPGATDRC